jgi:hypothetical protein
VSPQPYANVPDQFKTDKIPAQRYVIGKFSGSPAIGPWKVYPKAESYMEGRHISSSGETIEVYTSNQKEMTTEYLFPLKSGGTP